MAIFDIDNSSYVAYTGGVITADNRVGGVIKCGGTISTTNWTAQGLGDDNPTFNGAKVVSGVGGVDSILQNGTFAGGDQVIKRVTTDLAGVSNTWMRCAGSDSTNLSNSVKQLAAVRGVEVKTAIRANYWDEFSADWDTGYPHISVTGGWDISDGTDVGGTIGTSGTDVAANPSRTTPGYLRFMYGNPVPSGTTYKAKTS
jgi:hypothetical protein